MRKQSKYMIGALVAIAAGIVGYTLYTKNEDKAPTSKVPAWMKRILTAGDETRFLALVNNVRTNGRNSVPRAELVWGANIEKVLKYKGANNLLTEREMRLAALA
jgi:hypothetical protein